MHLERTLCIAHKSRVQSTKHTYVLRTHILHPEKSVVFAEQCFMLACRGENASHFLAPDSVQPKNSLRT